MLVEANAAVQAVYNSDWGRIVATLIRLIGDFEIAEDSAQEAFTAAVDKWRTSGVPEFPRAWIIQTARHKAIDRIRRRARSEEALDSHGPSEGREAHRAQRRSDDSDCRRRRRRR